MAELVALALNPGHRYVEAIQRVWADGNAIAPLDQRLPPAQQQRVLAALSPTAIIEDDGQQRALDGGTPVEAGDGLVIATSGTTGQPKAVIHTHQAIAASAAATSAALDVQPHSDKWLACLPVAHIGGLAVIMRSLVTGTPVEVHDGFEPAAATDAAHRGATLVSLVTRALNQVDPSLFRAVLIGGAAPPSDRAANVIATYGMTETGSGVVYDRRALDGLEIDVTDQGEIRLRGPMLFRAYRHDPNPFDPGGWFPTGDLGAVDEHGVLSVFGRAGDVIVSGGEKVWPAPIEAHLNRRGDIDEAVLVGRPHPDWGHQVVAVVVPADRQRPPSLDDLRDDIKTTFAPWCAPKRLELRPSLPKTALGKVQRDQL